MLRAPRLRLRLHRRLDLFPHDALDELGGYGRERHLFHLGHALGEQRATSTDVFTPLVRRPRLARVGEMSRRLRARERHALGTLRARTILFFILFARIQHPRSLPHALDEIHDLFERRFVHEDVPALVFLVFVAQKRPVPGVHH